MKNKLLNKTVLGSIFVILSGVLWGHTCYFVNELSGYNLSETGIAIFRLNLAFIFMMIYMLIFNRKKLKAPKKGIIFSVLAGLIGVIICSLIYFYAIRMTSESVAAVLMYTSPAFVVIISRILFKEKITAKKVICLVLSFVGAVLVSGLIGGENKYQVLGLIFGLIVGFSYALYSIFSSLAMKNGAAAEAVTTYAFCASAIAILIYAAITGQVAESFRIVLGNPRAIRLVLEQSTLDCIFPYILYTIGVKYTGASKAAIMSTTELVIASAIGAIKYGDNPGVMGYAGIVLVIVAIVLLNIEKNTKSEELN